MSENKIWIFFVGFMWMNRKKETIWFLILSDELRLILSRFWLFLQSKNVDFDFHVFFSCFLLNELMMLFDCCFKITQYKTHVHRSITITHSLNQVQSEFNSSAILQRKAWKMYHQFSDQFNNFVSRIKSKRLLCRHPTTEPSKSNRFVLPVDMLRQKCFTCKMKNKIKSYLS